METENQKVAEKYQELLSQNERLHGQAEQLTAQLKVLQRQSQDDDDAASIVSGISSAEKTAEELWDIIRYGCHGNIFVMFMYVCYPLCVRVHAYNCICMYVCMYVYVCMIYINLTGTYGERNRLVIQRWSWLSHKRYDYRSYVITSNGN